jgi:flagellin-like hook-associated protein FlgL
LDAIVNDSSYQGLNLITNPAGTLTVPLNEGGAATRAELTVTGTSMLADDHPIADPSYFNPGLAISYTEADVSSGNSSESAFTFWYGRANNLYGDGARDLYRSLSELDYIELPAAAANQTLIMGNVEVHVGATARIYPEDMTETSMAGITSALANYYQLGWATPYANAIGVDSNNDGTADAYYDQTSAGWDVKVHFDYDFRWTGTNYKHTTAMSVAECDSAIATVRSEAAKMGGNISLLQTRSNFTQAYVNTMNEAEGKLTNADLNEEGANLVSIQTRAELGVQALSFSGRQAEGLLSLFR